MGLDVKTNNPTPTFSVKPSSAANQRDVVFYELEKFLSFANAKEIKENQTEKGIQVILAIARTIIENKKRNPNTRLGTFEVNLSSGENFRFCDNSPDKTNVSMVMWNRADTVRLFVSTKRKDFDDLLNFILEDMYENPQLYGQIEDFMAFRRAQTESIFEPVLLGATNVDPDINHQNCANSNPPQQEKSLVESKAKVTTIFGRIKGLFKSDAKNVVNIKDITKKANPTTSTPETGYSKTFEAIGDDDL